MKSDSLILQDNICLCHNIVSEIDAAMADAYMVVSVTCAKFTPRLITRMQCLCHNRATVANTVIGDTYFLISVTCTFLTTWLVKCLQYRLNVYCSINDMCLIHREIGKTGIGVDSTSL